MKMTTTSTRSLTETNAQTAHSRNAAMLLAGIVLIAANLRTPLTSVSPLIELIRRDFPVSSTLAGLLTTLPLLAFAGLSPFVPRIARRFGMEYTLFVALIAMVAGSLVREAGGVTALLAGTVLAGLGIAAGNVLLPALIKKEFPQRLGLTTGIYSISMNLFAAAASAVSAPIANGTNMGWRGTFLAVAFIGVLALGAWIPQLKHNRASAVIAASAAKQKHSVWRSRLAWQITVFMGLQSFIFYVFVAWLPDMLLDNGMSNVTSGYMLSLLQVGLIPFAFLVPIIAGRLKNQLGLLLLTCCFYMAGFAGLVIADGSLAMTSISVVVLGIAGGTSFSLAMIFFSLRTRTAREASEISGMAQSIGYLLAAVGPFLFGVLHDAVHNWMLPMFLLVAAALLLLLVGTSPTRGSKFIFPEE